MTAVVTNIAEHAGVLQEFRLLAENERCSDDAIFSVTTDGFIQSWNCAAERIYQYTAGEILGRSVRVLSPPGLPGHTSDMLGDWKITGEVRKLELVLQRKDGRQILIE